MNRSNITVLEERRLISKDIIDSIFTPFSVVRSTPYLMLPEYSHLDELKEEALAQAWANIEVLKIEKQFNVAAKAQKRKEWWNKIFSIFGDSKIKFQ